jgi:hypothetical protein
MSTNQGTGRANPSDKDKPAGKGKRDPIGRGAMFFYDLAVVGLLIGAAAFFVKFPEHRTLGGPPFRLAIESMWFGALGGVIISLKGVYEHSNGPGGWDPSFNLWHLGRPISGAIAGLMTVVLLKTVNATGELTEPVVFGAAFIFGTQERRFFSFLYEVARLIVQVPEDAKTGVLKVTDIKPGEGFVGGVVVITGQGIEANAAIRLGNAPLDKLTISSDGMSAAGLIPAHAPGAETVDVVVANSSGANFVLPRGFKYTA